MTDQDRARLAQIVAWGVSRGESVEAIETRIAQYAPAAEADDIDRAFVEGQRAVSIARNLGTANEALAAQGLQAFSNAGVQQVRVLYRVRTGEGPDDWRSGAVTLGSGTSPAAILERAQSDAGLLLEDIRAGVVCPKDGRVVQTNLDESAPDYGRVELIYVAPL